MKPLQLVMVLLLGVLALNLSAQVAALTDAERDGIIFMAEEEKMARDVYRVLEAEYDIPVFRNISRSEQIHLDIVANLGEEFSVELPAPVRFDEEGIFANQDIQKLYDELVKRGRTSREEALRVGALIEETDIRDLRNYLKTTENPAVRSAYQRLENASHNHLRAFTRQLDDYEPVILSQPDFDEIVTQSITPGPVGARQGKGMGAGQGCCAGKGQGKGCRKKS